MRKVIIGFSKPKGFFKPFSWAIRLVERTAYSHVYIRARSEKLGVDLIYQASGSQVNFMGLEHFKTQATSVHEFECEIPDSDYDDFMRWAIINSGAPYSAKQPLGILLIKLFNLRKNPFGNGEFAWVCSELVFFFFRKFAKIVINENEVETIGTRGIFDLCEKNLKKIEVKP